MTRRRFDLTNAVGWVMVGFAFTLAAVGFLGLLKYWPLPTLAGCVLAVSHGLVWWLTGRNLRAELEAARERLMTFNGSESREALAEVGPIVPRLSGEQPAVEPIDVEPFMADSGYQPPRRTYSLDEVMDELCITQPEIDAADDGLVWCVQFDARGAWCALLHNNEPTIGETELETLCGWVGMLPGGLTRTLPTCVECEAFVRDNAEDEEVDGQRLSADGCPWAECPHPDRCDTGCRWGEEANQWADLIHVEDDGPETLPRVLPEGRID